MLRNPRVWAYAAGWWLIVAGLVQLASHVWGVHLEPAMLGQREFAMEAMKQAFGLEPLRPSLWRVHRMLGTSVGLLLVFAGLVPTVLAFSGAPGRVLASCALLGTVFWTVAFGYYAFVDPVILPLLAAGGAVPLHGILWLTATGAGARTGGKASASES